MKIPTLIGHAGELPASLAAPDNYAFKERDWRAPSVGPEDEIIFDEPGRVLGRDDDNKPGGRGAVDCRSHYFRVTKPRFGFYTLLVKHGGGEESWQLSYAERTIDGLRQMDSDARFWLLWVIMDAHHASARTTTERVESVWRRAAAEKRIKTRKVRSGVKVWIEPTA